MAVLKYSLLRLGVFALVFFGCLYLDLGRFTLIFAVIVGLAVSWAVGYLFFNSWRIAAGEQLAGWFGRRRRSSAEEQDNAAEDELAEEFHSQEPGGDSEKRRRPGQQG
ncbi:DUF4229 domain-containing protein [Nesterenkonia muleiensis]|uniref:DUF4229 domain-containing protein n=1 Tax=Nesterenkonia muleiensis TaxID=2282648 RepID=UPI000E71652C|nr:DUF4229 domain-containing protein [Nesterenkonia muleiensis]